MNELLQKVKANLILEHSADDDLITALRHQGFGYTAIANSVG